jgi:hypothetical protein
MQVTFDSFDEFADWVNRKYLAYEELKDENRQLEMDRLRLTDKVAELEHELFTLENKNGFLQSDCVPNMLKRKATGGNQ